MSRDSKGEHVREAIALSPRLQAPEYLSTPSSPRTLEAAAQTFRTDDRHPRQISTSMLSHEEMQFKINGTDAQLGVRADKSKEIQWPSMSRLVHHHVWYIRCFVMAYHVVDVFEWKAAKINAHRLQENRK